MMRSNPSSELAAEWAESERLARVRRRLLAWGRANFQRYPWRDETDPWLTLVAELLLQRTRASQVEPIFNLFRVRYPTARSLVKAGPEAATAVMERLGLHWRGRLLYAIALAAVEHGGLPPENPSILRRVPGAGMYTVAAWLSLHRGMRAVIVDSNVARWLARMTGLPYAKDPRHVKWVQQLADDLTPRRVFRDYNYAVLDFTMAVCTVHAPRCTACPLREDCAHGRELLSADCYGAGRGRDRTPEGKGEP